MNFLTSSFKGSSPDWFLLTMTMNPLYAWPGCGWGEGKNILRFVKCRKTFLPKNPKTFNNLGWGF